MVEHARGWRRALIDDGLEPSLRRGGSVRHGDVTRRVEFTAAAFTGEESARFAGVLRRDAIGDAMPYPLGENETADPTWQHDRPVRFPAIEPFRLGERSARALTVRRSRAIDRVRATVPESGQFVVTISTTAR